MTDNTRYIKSEEEQYIDKDLKSVLNRGEGIALIVSMVECPECKKDIWVEHGSHCGFDGNLDYAINTHCYECCEPIKFIIETVKDTGFMTISESTNFTTNKFIKNCSNKI